MLRGRVTNNNMENMYDFGNLIRFFVNDCSKIFFGIWIMGKQI
jgi:hypothetical protein